MVAAMMPPLPPGFTLDQQQGADMPPLPPGFTLDDAAAAPQAAPQPPSMVDRLQANPVIGAPLQTLLRGGQGIEQLLAHGLALTGIPGTDALASRVDQAIAGQNKGYEDAKRRLVGASTNPRATQAATDTGEVMGNMLNPVGLAGNLIKAGPGIANAMLRGGASGAAVGASQPVQDTPNYWLEKAKQTGGGAVVGGVTGAAAAKLGGEKLRPDSGPTTAQLKNATDEAYAQARESGAVVPKADFEAAIDAAEAEAKAGDLTYRPALHPKSAAALDQIRKDLSESADGIGFKDIEVARRIASNALESADKSDKAVGHLIIDKIDDFAESAGSNEFSGARELYKRSAKAATLDRIVEKAKNAVGANYTQAGYETAVRQKFRSLADNEKAFRRFSPDEQKAILTVVRGGPVENALRLVGKVAVRGPISAIPAGTALSMQHPGIAAAIAGGGEVARFGASQMAQRNVRAAQEMVRGAPLSALPRPAPNAPIGNTIPTSLLVQMLLKQRAQ